MKQSQINQYLVQQIEEEETSPSVIVVDDNDEEEQIEEQKNSKFVRKRSAPDTLVSQNKTPSKKSKPTSSSSSKSKSRDFFQAPTPNSPGTVFSFKKKQYNSLEPVFSFFFPRRGLKVVTEEDYDIKKYSLFEIAHFARELGKMKRDWAIGYTKQQVQQLQKKFKKLQIFDDLLKLIENNAPLPTTTEVEEEYSQLVTEVYEWMVEYMSAEYEKDKDIFFFLKQMRDSVPQEMKERMALTTTRISFSRQFGPKATNAMQVKEYKEKHAAKNSKKSKK